MRGLNKRDAESLGCDMPVSHVAEILGMVQDLRCILLACADADRGMVAAIL